MGNIGCCHEECHSAITSGDAQQDENRKLMFRQPTINKSNASSSKKLASVQLTQDDEKPQVTVDKLTGCLMVTLSEANFDARFLEIMKQKTKLIDISRMCLYIDFLGKEPMDKSQQYSSMESKKNEVEMDVQSNNSFDTYSNFTRKSRSLSQGYDISVVNRDIKGIQLRNASIKDQLSLKLIYILDVKFNKGFLVLSETNLQLSQLLQQQDEMINIIMEQKKKRLGDEVLNICHFKIKFKLLEPDQQPKSISQFIKLSNSSSQQKKNGKLDVNHPDFQISGKTRHSKSLKKHIPNSDEKKKFKEYKEFKESIGQNLKNFKNQTGQLNLKDLHPHRRLSNRTSTSGSRRTHTPLIGKEKATILTPTRSNSRYACTSSIFERIIEHDSEDEQDQSKKERDPNKGRNRDFFNKNDKLNKTAPHRRSKNIDVDA